MNSAKPMIKKHKDYLDAQISSIFKAMNVLEAPVKEKHVRAIIIGSYVGIGGEVFWNVVMENMPLQGNQFVCWKFCYVLYKLLRDGHPNVIVMSFKYKNRIKDLGRLWNHLKDEFGGLINSICILIAGKLDFHQKNPNFPHTLIIEQRDLDKHYTNNDAYFQLSAELLDYLENICKLQIIIFRTLELNNLNSLTLNGQFRIQPLIPCIQEAVLLYDHVVNILLRLHSNVDSEFLAGHRERFNATFKSLKKFFEESLRLQYLKNLVAIPQLTDAPNFVKNKPATKISNFSSGSSKFLTAENLEREQQSLYEQSKCITARHPSLPRGDESFYATLLRESKLLASGELGGPKIEEILSSIHDLPDRNAKSSKLASKDYNNNDRETRKLENCTNIELLAEVLGTSSASSTTISGMKLDDCNKSQIMGQTSDTIFKKNSFPQVTTIDKLDNRHNTSTFDVEDDLGRCSPDSIVTRQINFDNNARTCSSVVGDNDDSMNIEPYFHNGFTATLMKSQFRNNGRDETAIYDDDDDLNSDDTLSNVTSITFNDLKASRRFVLGEEGDVPPPFTHMIARNSACSSTKDSWTNTEKDFKTALYGTSYEDVMEKARDYQNLQTKNQALKVTLEKFNVRYDALKNMFENLRNSHYKLLKTTKLVKIDKSCQIEENIGDSTEAISQSKILDNDFLRGIIINFLVFESINFSQEISKILTIYCNNDADVYQNNVPPDAITNVTLITEKELEKLAISCLDMKNALVAASFNIGSDSLDTSLPSYYPIFQNLLNSSYKIFGPFSYSIILQLIKLRNLLKLMREKRTVKAEGINKIQEAIGNDGFEILNLLDVPSLPNLVGTNDDDTPVVNDHTQVLGNAVYKPGLDNPLLSLEINNFLTKYEKAMLNLFAELTVKCNMEFNEHPILTPPTTEITSEISRKIMEFLDFTGLECSTLAFTLTKNKVFIDELIGELNACDTNLGYLVKENNEKNVKVSVASVEEEEGANDLKVMEEEMEGLIADIDRSAQKIEREMTVLIKLPIHKIEDKHLLQESEQLILAVKILIEKAVALQKLILTSRETSALEESTITVIPKPKPLSPITSNTTCKESYCKSDKWVQGYISAAKVVGKNAILLVENVNKIQNKTVRYEELLTNAKELTKNLAQLIWAAKVKVGQYKYSAFGDKMSLQQEELFQASKSLTEKTQNILKSSHSVCMVIFQENLEVNLTNLSVHQAKLLEMECQIKVLELESQIEKERSKLLVLRKRNYHLPES